MNLGPFPPRSLPLPLSPATSRPLPALVIKCSKVVVKSDTFRRVTNPYKCRHIHLCSKEAIENGNALKKTQNKSERETGMGGGGRHVLQFFWQGDSLKVQSFHVLGCLKETGRISPLTGVTSYQKAADAYAGGTAAAPHQPSSPLPCHPPFCDFLHLRCPIPDPRECPLARKLLCPKENKNKDELSSVFP